MFAGCLHPRFNRGNNAATAILKHFDFFAGKGAFNVATIRQNTKPRLIDPFYNLVHLFCRILFAIEAA